MVQTYRSGTDVLKLMKSRLGQAAVVLYTGIMKGIKYKITGWISLPLMITKILGGNRCEYNTTYQE